MSSRKNLTNKARDARAMRGRAGARVRACAMRKRARVCART